jgi:predicted transcriptional regulator
MPMRISYISETVVGVVAAAATVPIAVPTVSSLTVSVIAIALSVLVTGLIGNWINAKQLRRTDADTVRIQAETIGIELENAARLLRMKEAEILELFKKIESLKNDVEKLLTEVTALRYENAKLTFALGTHLREYMENMETEEISKMLAKLPLEPPNGDKSSS